MDSQKVGQWIFEDLKDKGGNQPTSEIWNFIQKLERNLLLPCPRTADDLEMPVKGTVPREMNSFIVFRRQLAYVAKKLKSSEDGRILSKVASYIWNGASKSERDSYTVIAVELKKRHRQKNPNYTYERRKRKTNEEDFIILNADTLTQTQNKKKRKPKKSTNEPATAHQQECNPISTAVEQEQGNEVWLQQQFNNSQVNNSFTSQVDCVDYNIYNDDECIILRDEVIPQLRDEDIPQLYQAVTARNYTADLSSELNLQQQRLEEIPLLLSYDNLNNNSFFYYGDEFNINNLDYY